MSDKKKMTFKELRDYICEYNRTHNWVIETIKAVVVFTPDSFDKEYSEESRSYEFRSDNKTFRNCISNSLYASSLDGTDQGVRLDYYMEYYGNKPGWKVDYCYLVEEEEGMFMFYYELRYFRGRKDTGSIYIKTERDLDSIKYMDEDDFLNALVEDGTINEETANEITDVYSITEEEYKMYA